MLLPRLPLKNHLSVKSSAQYCYLAFSKLSSNFSVRLACLIHAASVHPELGSNSTKKRNRTGIVCNKLQTFQSCFLIERNKRFHNPVFSMRCIISIFLLTNDNPVPFKENVETEAIIANPRFKCKRLSLAQSGDNRLYKFKVLGCVV